ncbi:JmjC domain, hydroxylase-domain-containing protein [Tuber brumale]|nr:JmjC domain, hydroxylase-domain-containing protein [Tuber brumale]
MAAAIMDPVTTSGEGSRFEVVVEKRQPNNGEQFEVFPEEKDEEITPSYYYENMGIPVFEPTMDQFRSFKHFVNKINHYGMQSGIVKVIPPKEWTDSLASLEDKLKDIRIKNPIIQHMAGVAGEYRQENIEKQRTYNLPQWRQLCESSEHQPPAKRGERRKGQAIKEAPEREAEQAIADDEAFDGFDFRIHNADDYTPERCDELEKAYWRTLTYSNPLYGADMPGSLFDDSTTSWNVAKLENLLDCLGKKLPGVNTAYLYLGMWRSTFAWHLEDVDLYSINYIHFGAPKQWYSISREDKPKFEQVMRGKFFSFSFQSAPSLTYDRVVGIWPNDSKKCSQFLRHKNYLVSPSLLLGHGIKVNKLVHHQGEFVITFPFGYHSGYNLGYNCAESVNFATEAWLEYGRNAKKCECIKDSVWVDVDEIERKLRGESTEDEGDEIEYYYEDEGEDEMEANDLPTPPESVEGKPVKTKNHKKRKLEDGKERPAKVKKLRLKLSKEAAPEPCILCPNNIPYEELVATDDGQKAHRLCAIYTPETYFKWDEAQQQEVVANIPGIPRARLELRCIFCRSTKGACFQCSSKKCARAYHATCAAAAGVLVNMFDVPHYGEDGQMYPQTDIDFRCRFHRPKRPKGMDSEKLESDMVVRKFANSLIKGDVIQMQYYRGDIFGGVVIENRYSEECVVVNVLPKGTESLEVEWKWILAQDPSTVPLPLPLTEMPMYPTAQQSGVATTKAPKLIPEPDDPFCDEASGLKWGELIMASPSVNADQAPVNLSNSIWHYLGEHSTEYIAKYTDDPEKRVPNETASMGSTRKPRAKIIKTPAKVLKPTHHSLGPLQHSQALQSPYTPDQTRDHHSPQSHLTGARVDISHLSQQQLWPSAYRPSVPTDSSGTSIANIVADATKAFINEHALFPTQEHAILTQILSERETGMSASQPLTLMNGGARQHDDGFSNQESVQSSTTSNSMIDPQLMAQGTELVATPSQQIGAYDPVFVAQQTSALSTQATGLAHDMSEIPAHGVNSPEQVSALATGQGSPIASVPQSSPPSSALPTVDHSPNASVPYQPLSSTPPRKLVPLADIQAALAQLARAKAQEQKAKADVEAAQAEVGAARARARQSAAAAALGQTPAPPSQA